MFVKARTTPTGTTKYYRNLDTAEYIEAVRNPLDATDAKWYVRATTPGANYYLLATAGYADQATAQAAIETLLSPS